MAPVLIGVATGDPRMGPQFWLGSVEWELLKFVEKFGRLTAWPKRIREIVKNSLTSFFSRRPLFYPKMSTGLHPYS